MVNTGTQLIDRRWLRRPDGHEICVHQSGNPQGTPVLVLHGGPGGGSNPTHREFFDPRGTRLIQFDQRGTGSSTPKGTLKDNTTAHQLSDIEAIRDDLGITSWWVTGGSWGALLGAVYAQTHPSRVRGLVLRSLFLDGPQDIEWLTRGARAVEPEAHRQLLASVPDAGGAILPALFEAVSAWPEPHGVRAVRAWIHYERVLSGLARHDDVPREPTETDFHDTRIELHYLVNDFFLDGDQVASNSPSLGGIPGIVVQGEFDHVAPPALAHRLVRGWDTGRARVVPGARHSLQCPFMRTAWRAAIKSMIPPDTP